MNDSGQIILSIESAIAGGSISLLRDGVEVANWIGTSDVSKAEDLLANIDEILEKNGISAKAIDLLAVSAGPGSFTGIRIGLATALGLKNGLGIEMASENALKAMAFAHSAEGTISAAAPVGRNAVCIQTFLRSGPEVTSVEDPYTLSFEEFTESVKVNGTMRFLAHSSLRDLADEHPNVINFGSNIALAIAHICIEKPGNITAPLFISKSF